MVVRIFERTPSGPGGVSVLSIEGPGALELVAGWGVSDPVVGQLRFARLALQGEQFDEALVCVIAEDRVEVHLHGSPPLVQALLRQGSRSSAGEASPALEERARRGLADAPCELAARVLLDQVEGALRRELRSWADLDPIEGDRRLARLLDDSNELQCLFEPARVLLAGPVNGGKSTLFNLLVGGERVITSSEAGTTRDLIEARAELHGWPITLLDSAGLRELDEDDRATRIERAGQDSATRAQAAADLILWLRPPGAPAAPGAPRGVPLCELASCNDLPGGSPEGISALEHPGAAVSRVEGLFRQTLGLPRRPWIPGRPIAFDSHCRRRIAAWRGLGTGELGEQIEALLEGRE